MGVYVIDTYPTVLSTTKRFLGAFVLRQFSTVFDDTFLSSYVCGCMHINAVTYTLRVFFFNFISTLLMHFLNVIKCV